MPSSDNSQNPLKIALQINLHSRNLDLFFLAISLGLRPFFYAIQSSELVNYLRYLCKVEESPGRL
jgi:hypothetical protein